MEKRNLEDVSEFCGVPRDVIVMFIEEEWVHPIDMNETYLDEEDIARIKLIWELRSEFGVNNDSIPIILHLLDQLNRMHLELKKFRIH